MEMMRPVHSHHVQNTIQDYQPLSGIPISASPYPSFPTSVQHHAVNEHDLSAYAQAHHGGHHHPHLQDSGLHLNTGLSSEPSSDTRLHFHESSPISPQNHPPPDFRSHSHPHVQDGSHSLLGVPDAPPYISDETQHGNFDMLPPPAGTFSSWLELHDFVQSHASAHGYAMSINTTAKNRSRIKLACVCYGKPKNTHKLTPETRVRKNRVTNKTGCKMWVECKKQDDDTWVLRVAQPSHNHPGRPVGGWTVQRKRTWGVQGGRMGTGGVTARLEQERLDSLKNGTTTDVHTDLTDSPSQLPNASHSFENGGMVWKIVEQEMLRKGGTGQGRDRGVGRTVQVLEERLPGIQIIKRDVYNIRAQIKRMRKAAGQQIGEGLDDSDDEEDVESHDGGNGSSRSHGQGNHRTVSQIDPTLVAQCSDALENVTRHESEVGALKQQISELQKALAQRTKEVQERDIEIEHLRAQFSLANMGLYSGR